MEKTLMLAKIKDRSGQQKMRWLDGIINSMDVSMGKPREMVKDKKVLQSMGCKESDKT